MNLDIQTLVVISGIIFIIQVIALFIQYIINRTTNGVKWWLVGTTLWAVGVVLMPFVSNPHLIYLALISNPLVILGQIFLYVGTVRFLNEKENKGLLVCLFGGMLFFYYFFIFVYYDIAFRTNVLIIVALVISFITARILLLNKDKQVSGSTHFTAAIFLTYSLFNLVRLIAFVFYLPVKTYTDQGIFLDLSFIFPIFCSLLWTFGFIILLNQRLNADNFEEKEKLKLIFNTNPDAAIISRLSDGLIIDINEGYLNLTGYTREEIIGKTTLIINVWHKISDREKFVDEIFNNGLCENREYVFQRKDGSLLNGSISANIITMHGESLIVSFIHDITFRKKAEEAIRESEALYRSILNASPDDITITDLNGKILIISPAAVKMFGYNDDVIKLVGTRLVDYLIPKERKKAALNIKLMCKGAYLGPNEYHGIRKDKSIFDIEVNSGLIYGTNRVPVKMVFIVRDISERKQTEQKIQELVHQLEIEKKTAQQNANTDSLTGLSNRRFFDEALLKELHRLKRSKSQLSLIMLDVDHFKNFNDHYGHLSGDECLIQIGSTFKTIIGRANDVVARIGGDEFVAILPETELEGALIIAERFRKTVEDLAIPYTENKTKKFITVSIGVVSITHHQVLNASQVLEQADEAMYTAKRGGRNRISTAIENQNLLQNH